MPRIATQAQFQRWPKPNFCYLCGQALDISLPLNDDHCPPQGMFAVADRSNYALKIQVHAQCNHKWHLADETMAVFLDGLHVTGKADDPQLLRKLHFVEVENDQGVYRGITQFPMRPLAHRIIRCMHALLYGEFLAASTNLSVHYPIPEVDVENGNRPVMHEMQTYQFANELCTAQRTGTADYVRAYNGQFKYVCTWHKTDNGLPICLFAFDIYRMADFAVRIPDYPRAFIGLYGSQKPRLGSECSQTRMEHGDNDILYPLLEA